MDFEAWETEIINALNADGILPDGIQAFPMPETPKEWEREYEDARILVGFNNVKWNKDIGLDLVDQTATIEFGIIIQANILRGAKGAYVLFNTVKKNIVGMTLTHCKRMRSDDFKLYNDDKGQFVFVYFVNCECNQAPFIADMPPIIAENITRLTGDEIVYYNPNDPDIKKTINDGVIDVRSTAHPYTPPEV